MAVKRPVTTATVRDIAAHAGVSIATVSRVLNQQANVTSETRDLVHQAISQASPTLRRQTETVRTVLGEG